MPFSKGRKSRSRSRSRKHGVARVLQNRRKAQAGGAYPPTITIGKERVLVDDMTISPNSVKDRVLLSKEYVPLGSLNTSAGPADYNECKEVFLETFGGDIKLSIEHPKLPEDDRKRAIILAGLTTRYKTFSDQLVLEGTVNKDKVSYRADIGEINELRNLINTSYTNSLRYDYTSKTDSSADQEDDGEDQTDSILRSFILLYLTSIDKDKVAAGQEVSAVSVVPGKGLNDALADFKAVTNFAITPEKFDAYLKGWAIRNPQTASKIQGEYTMQQLIDMLAKDKSTSVQHHNAVLTQILNLIKKTTAAAAAQRGGAGEAVIDGLDEVNADMLQKAKLLEAKMKNGEPDVPLAVNELLKIPIQELQECEDSQERCKIDLEQAKQVAVGLESREKALLAQIAELQVANTKALEDIQAAQVNLQQQRKAATVSQKEFATFKSRSKSIESDLNTRLQEQTAQLQELKEQQKINAGLIDQKTDEVRRQLLTVGANQNELNILKSGLEQILRDNGILNETVKEKDTNWAQLIAAILSMLKEEMVLGRLVPKAAVVPPVDGEAAPALTPSAAPEATPAVDAAPEAAAPEAATPTATAIPPQSGGAETEISSVAGAPLPGELPAQLESDGITLAVLQAVQAAATNEKARLENHIQSLKSTDSTNQEKILELKNLLEAHKQAEAAAAASSTSADLSTALTKSEEKVGALQAKLDELKGSLRSAEANLAGKQAEIDTMLESDREKTNLQKTMNDTLKASISTKHQEVASLTQLISNQQGESANTQEKLRVEVSRIKDAMTAMKAAQKPQADAVAKVRKDAKTLASTMKNLITLFNQSKLTLDKLTDAETKAKAMAARVETKTATPTPATPRPASPAPATPAQAQTKTVPGILIM